MKTIDGKKGGARQFNNSRNQQLFFNEEERVDDLLIVDGCALPARCAPSRLALNESNNFTSFPFSSIIFFNQLTN